MATSYQISPPENFNFTQPQEWPKWLRRFERFRVASGLASKEDEIQVNTLLYSMGDQADDILRSFKLSEADGKKYTVVKGKFEAHFVKRRNVIFERAKFNKRKQEEGEPVDSFITDLYALAEHCGYGDLYDEMIRDRIVAGLRGANLSEKLQFDDKLTLDTAVKKARESEAVKEQQSVVRGDEPKKPETPVGAVHKGRRIQGKTPYVPRWKRGPGQGRPGQRRPAERSTCYRCGKSPPHDRSKCPAKDATCHKCRKKGHFERSAQVGIIAGENVPADGAFLGAVSAQLWVAKVKLNGVQMNFRIDTGAEVTVISEQDYDKLKPSVLLPTQRSLRGPSNEQLQIVGRFYGKIEINGKEAEQTVYVVKGLHKALLGQPAIRALKLIERVGAVQTTKPEEQFPQLFTGLGKLEGEYEIKLREGAQPFALNTPRRVPVPLMESVKDELNRMEQLGVITPVEAPTDWCSGMVVVPKSNGRVRICVDLTKLDENVYRERHPLPVVDQTLAQIAGARIFSKLDANSGFWQIPLSDNSALLTTFITPFGRYCFQRLPFGITSAPEHFQRRMSSILRGTAGVVCLMDDVLVYGESQEEHDERLLVVMKRLQDAGLTLNKEKCSFSQREVRFLGQILTENGVQSDPDKVAAIVKIEEPANVKELRRFLGMANQLSKFTPNLAEKTKPLRDLLSKKNQWVWSHAQDQAFAMVKQALTESPILALFDPRLETTVSADASSYGLGAVLLQTQKNGERRPVAYVSRSMTPTETRYAQIEKEALALTWACERYSDYLVGLQFNIETDHKPLIPLFSTKLLDELPIRVQRFRMRMMRFDFKITHVPGKDLTIADTLSRAPASISTKDDQLLQSEADVYVQAAMLALPATEKRLNEIRKKQKEDQVCDQVMRSCKRGWPTVKSLPASVRKFYPVAAELSIQRGLLLRGGRLVIPTALRRQVLNQLHEGHQGIKKCRDRERNKLSGGLECQTS